MQMYDGWELLQDDKNPQREKMLGKGGQGEVYLARSPEQLMKRKKAEQVAKHQLIQVNGGQWDIVELAKYIIEAGSPDPVETLGALKKFIIPFDNKDEEKKAIGRLESEVEALQTLKGQPGILQLRHTNVEQRFIVTEYHPNGTLNKKINRFKGNALGALEAFKPLVEAVCKIHEAKAIHRDIKTENIFVTTSNSLVLGDFGIVFFQEGSDRLTTTYERVGTHYWMAPWAYDNARLELSKISSALDVYPLVKVLWSMIAGRNGFAFWEYDRDENNLEKLFPDDPVMPLVNWKILSKRIVRDEKKCDGSAVSLLADVQDLIAHLKISLGYRPEGAITWSCAVCGKGTYKVSGANYQLKAFRQGGPISEQEIVLHTCICDHCGHVELFKR